MGFTVTFSPFYLFDQKSRKIGRSLEIMQAQPASGSQFVQAWFVHPNTNKELPFKCIKIVPYSFPHSNYCQPSKFIFYLKKRYSFTFIMTHVINEANLKSRPTLLYCSPLPPSSPPSSPLPPPLSPPPPPTITFQITGVLDNTLII